jgi:hypothetical protein
MLVQDVDKMSQTYEKFDPAIWKRGKHPKIAKVS